MAAIFGDFGVTNLYNVAADDVLLLHRKLKALTSGHGWQLARVFLVKQVKALTDGYARIGDGLLRIDTLPCHGAPTAPVPVSENLSIEVAFNRGRIDVRVFGDQLIEQLFVFRDVHSRLNFSALMGVP